MLTNISMRNEEKRPQAELVIVTALIVLYCIFRITGLLYSAVGLGLIFLYLPLLGRRLVELWFKSAELLGRINSKVLLTVVFVLFLTPLAFLFRLFIGNPLISEDRGLSQFVSRNHTYSPKDLENIW